MAPIPQKDPARTHPPCLLLSRKVDDSHLCPARFFRSLQTGWLSPVLSAMKFHQFTAIVTAAFYPLIYVRKK